MRVLSEAVLELLGRTSHFPDTTFQNFKLRGGGCAWSGEIFSVIRRAHQRRGKNNRSVLCLEHQRARTEKGGVQCALTLHCSCRVGDVRWQSPHLLLVCNMRLVVPTRATGCYVKGFSTWPGGGDYNLYVNVSTWCCYSSISLSRGLVS